MVPPALVIARYFADEQETIEKLAAEVAAIGQAMEEMAEEHSGEEGLLEEAKNDKDKLTKASVAERLKEIKGNADAADERKVLNDYLALIEKESATSAKVKAAQETLMAKVAAQYGKLTEDEIKTLVVDCKWLATLAAAVQGELDRVSQTLTGRIRHLDLWFERVVKKKMKGRVAMCRYADDAVVFFQREEEARQFIEVLRERMGKFGLELNPEKTRILRFDRRDRRSGVFDFLGLTFYWGQARNGLAVLKCKTSRKQIANKVRQFTEWIKSIRSQTNLRAIWAMAQQKLKGHYRYYGVSWNSEKLGYFGWICEGLLYKWLNRRGQRRSFTRETFARYLKRYPLPRPIVTVHLY